MSRTRTRAKQSRKLHHHHQNQHRQTGYVLEDYTGKDSTEVFRDLNKKGIKWTETETYSMSIHRERWSRQRPKPVKRWQRAMKSAFMSA